MPPADHCPRCGTKLDATTSPEGLCPACLMQQGLEEFPGTDGEQVGQQATETAREPDRLAVPGRAIGPYRLRQKLGEGGMGEVWAAEQQTPVRRKVALKLIKRGMDTKYVIARFESERQALAMMDHPNIARVFDAGATPSGRPYFAMELVRGVPITEHCDRHRLSTAERLELFARVCEGVQHAHQKGIIHRDLKPSNVLVTIDGEQGVPKIIDFGVAKAIEQRLTEKTVFTELGVLVGTPEYMSPEQADLTAQDIDTRTDVYSLGVLLYQLLSGALPFEPLELRLAGYDEIRRKIREEDPPKPSTRVSTLAGKQSAEAAKARRTDPSSLRRQLRGDLDWISMKALEKDRTRRYGSPSELAADVRRHLGHEPVEAGPPSAGYRARKFVRRHRAGVGFAAALLLVLVGFAATMTVQARRIARERDRANEEADRANREAETASRVSEFMVRLFEIPDPGEARGNTVTAREILDRGSRQIERGLGDQPLVKARLLATMGATYRNLGLSEHAIELLEQALSIQQQHLAADDLIIATTEFELGWAIHNKMQEPEAIEHWERCLAIRRKLLPANHPDLASILTALGFASINLGVTAERGQGMGDRRWNARADAYYEQAEIAWNAYLQTHPDTVDWRVPTSFLYFGLWHADRGRSEKALLYTKKALELFERIEASGGYFPIEFLSKIGRIYEVVGDLERARDFFVRSIHRDEEIFGPDHFIVAHELQGLGALLLRQGRPTEAIPYLERALPIRVKQFGPESERAYNPTRSLALAYLMAGEPGEARPHYRRVIALHEKLERIGWLHLSVQLADLVRDAGEYEDARRLYEDLIDRAGRARDAQLIPALRGYAELLRRTGREDDAAVQEDRAAELEAEGWPRPDGKDGQ